MPRTLINLLLVLGVLAALVLGAVGISEITKLLIESYSTRITVNMLLGVVLGLGLGGVAVTLWRYKY